VQRDDDIGHATLVENRRKMIFLRGGLPAPRAPGGTVRAIISHSSEKFSAPWVIPKKFYFAQSVRFFLHFARGDIAPSVLAQ